MLTDKQNALITTAYNLFKPTRGTPSYRMYRDIQNWLLRTQGFEVSTSTIKSRVEDYRRIRARMASRNRKTQRVVRAR